MKLSALKKILADWKIPIDRLVHTLYRFSTRRSHG